MRAAITVVARVFFDFIEANNMWLPMREFGDLSGALMWVVPSDDEEFSDVNGDVLDEWMIYIGTSDATVLRHREEMGFG